MYNMKIGVPKEIKIKEDRVAITPQGVSVLTTKEHTVYVEKSAGVASGFSDEEYKEAGAVILSSAEEVYDKSDIILKVKEPQPSEYKFLKKNQILLTYLHLAIEKALTNELVKKKIKSISYETRQTFEDS